MTTQTSYTEARAHLADLMDRAGEDLETVIIRRRGAPDVALVSADELRGLQEMAHLFRSPANARRLLESMERAEAGDVADMSPDQLRVAVGLPARAGSMQTENLSPQDRPVRQPRRRLRQVARSPQTGEFEVKTPAPATTSPRGRK